MSYDYDCRIEPMVLANIKQYCADRNIFLRRLRDGRWDGVATSVGKGMSIGSTFLTLGDWAEIGTEEKRAQPSLPLGYVPRLHLSVPFSEHLVSRFDALYELKDWVTARIPDAIFLHHLKGGRFYYVGRPYGYSRRHMQILDFASPEEAVEYSMTSNQILRTCDGLNEKITQLFGETVV